MANKLRIGIQLAWLNDGKHANYIGDAGVADAWAKWLSRREDVYGVQIFGRESVKLHFKYNVLINFHPGLLIHPMAKNILYSQNAWSEEQHLGGTVGVFNAVKDRYQGYLFPSEKLRQLCGGEGAVVPFATDETIMTHQIDERYRYKCCFVGNCIRPPEVNAKLLPFIERGLVIHGGPWVSPYDHVHRGRISNEDLPKCYSGSRVQLNLTLPEHAANGVTNARIYDILACGGIVLSDIPVEGELGKFVWSLDDFDQECFDQYEYRTVYREQAREAILAGHTFGHRMESLMSYLRDIV